MSTWGKVILTKQGEALLNQCLGMSGHYNLNQSNDPDSDTKGIVITRVSTGRYRYTNTSVEYLKERTDLATSDGATGGTSGFVENLNITGLKPITSSNSDQYGQALIQVQLDNQREDRNIKEEYPLGQLGVFARLEGSTEEILFTIVQYAGDTLPVIPAPVTPTLLNFGFYIAIATTETISIEMEYAGIVTAKQFDDYKLVTDETLNTLNEHTKNTENPHKVTAQQVGLGNVPNVTTDNQTPTFTQSSTLSEINSGEKLSTLFGKIKKAIVDLISHLANTSNPHSVTKSQVGLGNVDDTSDADKPISTATRKALDGKAPKTHASSSEDYGIGNSEVYGHLKLFNGINSTADTQSGFAATPNAVKTAYEKAVEGVNAAEKAQETANSKLDKGFISNGYTGIDEVTARLNGIEEGAEVNKVTSVQGRTGDVTVTKADIDLGNVPNVTTNNQTPTFTAASSRTNINSGETLATIFGKIKKWFSDLKTIAFTGSYTDLLNKPTSLKNPYYLELYLNGGTVRYDGSVAAGETWYAPTSGGTAGYNLISNGSGAPVWQQLPYAVCNTSGSTVAKTVSITNFKLVTGVRVFIKFTYAHDSTTKATLNVNNTGAKSIRYKGYGVFKGYNGGYNSTNKQYPNSWEAGEIVEFIYDGTEWVSTLEKRKIDHSNIVVGTINVDGYRIPPSINDVDFMCGIDGKSDVEVIQEAINASRNGSRIILKKGNYSIDAPIYMYGGNHANKLFGEQATDVPKLNFSNNGIITSRSSSSDSKLYYSLYFENISMELTPQLCIEGASIYFDNVYSRLDVTTAQNLGSTPIKSSGLFKVKNGSDIDFWIRSSSSYIRYCGIDCTTIEVDDSSISLQNECSSTQGGDDLNFIYNTNAKGYIRNSKLTGQGNGRTNFINGQVTIDECDITLKNSNHSLCHYTTNAERKLCSLRDCTINYTASTYLTFGKIEGCFFINTVTGVNSSENYKLQILCPTQMIGNTFIGRSEMNFNSNKVQFIGNAMQYSQSYTSFPTGSVNTGTMITG